LSKEVSAQIPKSTLQYWRKTNMDNYFRIDANINENSITKTEITPNAINHTKLKKISSALGYILMMVHNDILKLKCSRVRKFVLLLYNAS
jgi:hypothetical protein